MNCKLMTSVVCVAAMMSGCVTYQGITTAMDDMSDETNQPYAAEAHKAFLARIKAPPRPVVVVEAPEMGLFLDPQKSAFGGHPLCNNLGVRKEVSIAFKSQLRSMVSSIKDFRLVDEAAAMVSVGDEVETPSNYRLTYNITSLEIRERPSDGSTKVKHGKHKYDNEPANAQKTCIGMAMVEVRLFKPDGKTSIFSFTGEGSSSATIDQKAPADKSLLLKAVEAAADDAMSDYALKFGPPIYVTETCQSGRFVKLSVGAKFGIQKGQRIEFYRNKIRKGVDGEEEVARQVVGSGIVGDCNAPIEDDGAWVFVENYNAENRQVFRWTSARIVNLENSGWMPAFLRR